MNQFIVVGLALLAFGFGAVGYAFGRKESSKVILTSEDDVTAMQLRTKGAF